MHHAITTNQLLPISLKTMRSNQNLKAQFDQSKDLIVIL